MNYKHTTQARTGCMSAAHNERKTKLEEKVVYFYKENGKKLAFCAGWTELCSVVCDYAKRVQYMWKTCRTSPAISQSCRTEENRSPWMNPKFPV